MDRHVQRPRQRLRPLEALGFDNDCDQGLASLSAGIGCRLVEPTNGMRQSIGQRVETALRVSRRWSVLVEDLAG